MHSTVHIFKFTKQLFFQVEPFIHWTRQLFSQVQRVLVPRSVGREGRTVEPFEFEVGGCEGMDTEVERQRSQVSGTAQDTP